MATFSKQETLPPLPVPGLSETLDRYLTSALVLLNDSQRRKTMEEVEVFRDSAVAEQLQNVLVDRKARMKNWLQDWWYDAYCEDRRPLVPYVSLAASSTLWSPLVGSQICRAADNIYYWMLFWDKVRKETLPITRSRGTVWDMHQYRCLFNACRVPELNKDRMERYFRTESEGDCPSHVIVLCRGNIWQMETLRNGQLKTPDEFYNALQYIDKHSEDNAKFCLASMTTENRDRWAKVRASMIAASETNAMSFQSVETACFCITVADKSYSTTAEALHAGLMGESYYQWADKSLNIIACKDGRILVQGEHSNVDAIVVIHAGDYAALRSRKSLWHPKEASFQEPTLLKFDQAYDTLSALNVANERFLVLRSSFRVKSITFSGYGSDLVRKYQLYTDTVIQIALQLAFLRTHSRFAPIYETASTRKFFNGRTETVRGCTQEMVTFGQAVMDSKNMDEQKRLFMAAYDAHNQLMDDAMNGNGIDRHLYGLLKALEWARKDSKIPIPLPAIFEDEAYTISGGYGNFLLSTSFIGYMGENDEVGSYGYVTAMCRDGYGAFYRIGKERLQVTITDWIESQSNLDEYGDNIVWSLMKTASLFSNNAKL
ncbi:Peroxisomal carnitine O-octanoyltransferase [Trichostrongylus colubriformis]|uniref:Peroxisomal carnitine O-octanoyltransferase n=1 Tax=Trichostrongylus colubriformis TaxID=6319 RepID=A0AAN8FSU4_TRICO